MVRGPQGLYQGGKTWLVYSASYCGTASYALGLVRLGEGHIINVSSSTTAETPPIPLHGQSILKAPSFSKVTVNTALGTMGKL